MWGAFYGVLLIIEKFFLLKFLKKAPAVIGHIYTLLAVAVGWVLFAFEDFGAGLSYLKAMFGGALFCDSASVYLMLSYLPLLVLCALASTPLGIKIYRKIGEKCGSSLTTVADCFGTVTVMGLAAAYLVSGSYNPFLYFRF